ncbi:lipoprotein [Natronolimnohabitans innermongolicus JCM 12255]|uniref:Lipoprotein n=1 Tax=Natronolimnohabitans innermongolicus JCM 12255 TaxID=1227499 RepID=L9WRL3_9EURY|nr:lipoprotein [Natronolimnohabitans innermongolicus JCM 12255]
MSSALAGCAGDGDNDDNDADDGSENGDDSSNGDENGNGENETGEGGPERSDAGELRSLIETLDDDPLFDPGTETFSGSGDSVTDEVTLESALTVVVADFDDGGFENYQVTLEGESDELLVNSLEGGLSAGAVPTSNGEYLFDVTAPAEWELTVGQPLAPDEEIRTLPVEAAGSGPDVVGPVELDGSMTVSGEHDGEENFQVHIFDEGDTDVFSGEMVFNEIGEYEGETLADYSGICWLDVEADGEWSLEIE